VTEAVVHVVDDDAAMRDAIAATLRSFGLAAATYESCAAFLTVPPPAVPCCLLLDVRMPGSSGLDFLARHVAQPAAMPVVVLTAYADVPMSVQAMKAGAMDFLTKPYEDTALLTAVRAALARHAGTLEEERKRSLVRTRHASLTGRERVVLELVVLGKLNKQVAHELGVSEITVKLARAAMMRKMGARTLADLVGMMDGMDRTLL
jgi:FixJ family two-component response regulator